MMAIILKKMNNGIIKIILLANFEEFLGEIRFRLHLITTHYLSLTT